MPDLSRLTRRLRGATQRLIFDLRFGSFTGGLHKTQFAQEGACDTVSTDLRLLPALLDPVIKEGDVFVDIGCGRGRVLNWVIDQGRAKLVFGIELDKRIASKVAARLAPLRSVTVIAGDALVSLPDAVTVMYLWNPFDQNVMQAFRDIVIAKYRRLETLGNLRIIYHNALHIDAWEECSDCTISEIAMPAWVGQRAVLIQFSAGPSCSPSALFEETPVSCSGPLDAAVALPRSDS